MVFAAFTWVFAFSVVASFVESYGIGANDLANAFGTSVVCIAAVCEFLGAFLLGANTTSTIKGGVADPKAFADQPEVLMYGMMCVMVVSAFWDIFSCTLELQVSTTHTTVGAILGMTLVTKGPDAVIWYQKDTSKFPPVKGFVSILIGWIISPLVAMAFTSFVFFLLRTFVLRAKNSTTRALYCLPIAVFATTFAISATVIQVGTSNGSWNVSNSDWPWIAAVVGVTSAALSLLLIPLLKKRVAYLEDQREQEKASAIEAGRKAALGEDIDDEEVEADTAGKGHLGEKTPSMLQRIAASSVGKAITDNKVSKSVVKSMTFDIHHILDKNDPDYDPKAAAMWDNAEVFDWRTEEIFKYLQIFTACVMSFSHGANDVANAMGPFSVVYYIWENSAVPASKVPVQDWVLAYGGIAISIGLATYGWKIMRLLGAKSIKLTNSRGFTIELCVALVVIICARYGIPVSTSHLSVFSTVAVGCFEGRQGVNWRMVIKTVASMFITIGIAMGLSAGMTAFTMYGPYIPGPPVLGTSSPAPAASA